MSFILAGTYSFIYSPARALTLSSSKNTLTEPPLIILLTNSLTYSMNSFIHTARIKYYKSIDLSEPHFEKYCWNGFSITHSIWRLQTAIMTAHFVLLFSWRNKLHSWKIKAIIDPLLLTNSDIKQVMASLSREMLLGLSQDPKERKMTSLQMENTYVRYLLDGTGKLHIARTRTHTYTHTQACARAY